jgi:hypothetical protein
VAVEILLWAAVVAILLGVGRGLAHVAGAGFLRVLLSPVTLVAVVAVALFVRARRSRRRRP